MYLDHLDHKTEGEGEGCEDEQYGDDDHKIGAHALALLAGWGNGGVPKLPTYFVILRNQLLALLGHGGSGVSNDYWR